MNKLKTTVLILGLLIGLSSGAIAQQQQENQTQSQVESFQVTGECVMIPANETDSESPFMTCQYTRTQDSQMDGQSLFDQMMERMEQMMGGNQSMQGQGMNGQGMGGQ